MKIIKINLWNQGSIVVTHENFDSGHFELFNFPGRWLLRPAFLAGIKSCDVIMHIRSIRICLKLNPRMEFEALYIVYESHTYRGFGAFYKMSVIRRILKICQRRTAPDFSCL
jgi:hypothetical protein